MPDLRDAEDAVKAFDGMEFHGKRLRVEIARGMFQICSNLYLFSNSSCSITFFDAARDHFDAIFLLSLRVFVHALSVPQNAPPYLAQQQRCVTKRCVNFP